MSSLRILVLCALAGVAGATELSLAGVFSDNMVLQRERSVPVWGWATPGTAITVSCNGRSESATSGADGSWSVRLAPLPAGGPYQLEVAGGTAAVKLGNVLAGDVWLCSGQSNMAFGLGGCNAVDDVKAAGLPQVRYTYVWEDFAGAPQRDIAGSNHWQVMSPATAPACSAVGFYFARKVQRETGVPIGILVSSVGGTEIECWMSAEALEGRPENASAANAYRQAIADWTRGLRSAKAAPGSRPAYLAVDQPIGLEVAVPWAAKVRAALAGTATAISPELTALESWMKAADAALSAHAAVPAPPAFDALGKWLLGAPLPPELKRIPLAPHPLTDRHGVGGHGWFRSESLYNGMIHPLVPFAFKGMLWYQGENGSGPGPHAWYERMRALVETMRAEWHDDFPVYLVQIANWRDPPSAPQPADPSWPITRMAQLECLRIPRTGLAVTIDIGDAADIHPKNKRDVGERLALWALNRDYGHRDLVCSGPLYQGIAVEDGRVRVRFDALGGGLMVGRKPGPGPAVADPGASLKQFAIAGADKVWHWADAAIDGATVVVSSPDVPHPVAVRYAFAMNPAGCNLYNRDGLPASPFRSDDW